MVRSWKSQIADEVRACSMMKPKENTRPAASVEVLETVRREFRFPMRDKWESQPNMFGMAAAEERTLVTRQNAEEVIAAKDARIAELEAKIEAVEADDDAYSSGFDAGFGEANMTRNKRAELAECNLAKETAKVAHRNEALRNIIRQRDTLEADNKRLRDALEPFAEYGEDHFDKDHNGNPLPDEQGVGWIYMNFGHFRKARAALGEVKP